MQLDRRGQRRAAGGLGPDAFGLGQQLDRVDDLARRVPLAPQPPDLAHDLCGVVTVGGIADRDALGDRVAASAAR